MSMVQPFILMVNHPYPSPPLTHTQKTYDEAIGAFQEGASRDSRTSLNRDDKIHGSLLMINELIMNSAWSEEVGVV